MAGALDDRIATAIIFPTCIDGVEGILAACCTKTSNLFQRCHKRTDGSIILNTPAWLLFECYFFAGMCLLNWSAMTDPAYAVLSRPIGLLGDFLNTQCLEHGIENFTVASGCLNRGIGISFPSGSAWARRLSRSILPIARTTKTSRLQSARMIELSRP